MTEKKLHILFLNSWYPSLVLANNGDFIQRHAEAVASKHQVTALHVISNESIKNETITDREIHGVRTLITYLKPEKSVLKKQILFFKSYKKLISMCGDFDLVHVNRLFPAGLMAIWLKLFHRKPYIISEHFTGYLAPFSSKLSKAETTASKLISQQAHYVCPVSQNLAENMQNLGLQGNYYPVPNVVDTEIFTSKASHNERFTLIHVSSLVNDHKNVTGILQVIARLQEHIPDFLFYLIGNNPFQYQDLIESLKINTRHIELIDQLPHHEVASYLQNSDVLILFSNYENLPCVILEAFACGTKVIATDVGGINEFFPKNFGRLIRPKDEDQLLESILEIYKSLAVTEKSDMHQYAESHFGVEKICNEFSNLYYKSLPKNQA